MKLIWLACLLAFSAQASTPKVAADYAGPDERYKADILLIVAHPDDETGDIANYFARAILEQHRRVAVIYTTHGDAGGNEVGNELGKGLGVEREIEARQALAYLGVTNVWFLDGYDTPAQNVLHSLEYMDHGSLLAQTIRLVRVTRPEVIITWLPMPVAGENHADHQAASVVANEAFDLAGDSTAFAEQLGTGEDSDMAGFSHDPEGLRPWQPKKIYYYSDAFDAGGYWLRWTPQPSPFRKNFLDGAGPQYSSAGMSPAKGMPYTKVMAEQLSFYLTQDGLTGKEALAHRDFKAFEFPTRFVFGKSLVGGSKTGDIFENVKPEPIAYVRPTGAAAQTHSGISLQLGGQWAFYREFWRAHALDNLADLLPIPEFGIALGRTMDIPLIIRNDTDADQEVTLSASLPEGWTERASSTTYRLRARSTYPVHRILIAAKTGESGWYEMSWKAEAGGRPIGSVSFRAYATARRNPD